MQMQIYNSSLLMLTKNLVDDKITVDEFKAGLAELCNVYRKEKKNVKQKTFI